MDTSDTSYNGRLQAMYSLRRFGIKLGLDTIRRLLERLGNPQNRFVSIHIAGTNGKGSVASTLATILRLRGYKTGLYTSPHLVRFNERICIDARPISDRRVIYAYDAVKEAACGMREATFFEYATAMALHEFARQKVDCAVIETGMGGRLDATNVIQPAVSIVSNVSLEHQKYLGNTLAAIAAEKGGIIKSRTPVITGVNQKQALAVLRQIAAEHAAPFYRLGEQFRVRRQNNGAFTYFGIDHVWRNLRTALNGRYQIDNAALALAACELLPSFANESSGTENSGFSRQHIQAGLATTQWPGRLEIVADAPAILIDGAHNLAAARKLAQFLAERFSGRHITLITGILEDKPHEAMLRHLLPLCRRVIVTRSGSERSIAPEKLYAFVKNNTENSTLMPDVAHAVRHAVETASAEDVICIAGSLYIAGEAKQALAGGILKPRADSL